MQFDAKAAKLLEPGQHFTISDCPGLRLEATATTRTWVYRFKSPVDQRMRQVKIGAWPKLSIAGATVEWERLRAIRSEGRDPAEERRVDRQEEKTAKQRSRDEALGRLTVRKLCDHYLEGHVVRHRKAKGATEVARMFDRMLGDFGALDAAKVTRAQAFDLLSQFIDTPVIASYLRAELGAAWDYGHDAGRLDENAPNWWRLIMRGKLRSKGHVREGESIGTSKRVLSAAEIGTLIQWLPNFSRLVNDVVTMYMWTCARGSEILAIDVSEITHEEDGMWWTVPKAKTKNARHESATDLRIPLVGRAATIVKRRVALVKTGYIFPASGVYGFTQQKTVSAMVWMRQPYAQTREEYNRARLPVTHWSVHDLRRTGRTQLAALGCRDEVAEAALGHMPSGIVGVYNLHRYDAERREWLTKLSDHYEKLAALDQ